MNRELFKLPFTLDEVPDWICPSCEKGILRVKRESFLKEESKESRENSHDPYFGFISHEVHYVYICLLICSNDKCREVITNTGIGFIDIRSTWIDEEGECYEDESDFFRPKYFQPPLKLIKIPADCPKTVQIPLHESFELFFSSPSSAANRVRISLENLLTELKVERFSTKKEGGRKLLSLHERIELLPEQYTHFKDVIFAIKWLGNAGSHSNDEISSDDVMDAYDLIEHVLEEIYEQKGKRERLQLIARKVNEKKGPA